jgi:hypothetical protein
MGYANRVVKIDFPSLSDDSAADPIWVILRNPRLMPSAELTSLSSDGNSGYEQTEDGKTKVTDPAAAIGTMHKMIARLVVAARVYDATTPGEFDPETGEPTGEQPRLPAPPWTPETAAKLPPEIVERISREFTEAVNPQKGQDATTPNASSGPPSPSSTEPGADTETVTEAPQPS